MWTRLLKHWEEKDFPDVYLSLCWWKSGTSVLWVQYNLSPSWHGADICPIQQPTPQISRAAEIDYRSRIEDLWNENPAICCPRMDCFD